MNNKLKITLLGTGTSSGVPVWDVIVRYAAARIQG